MSRSIIKSENLSKLYRFDAGATSLRELTALWWNKLQGKKQPSFKERPGSHFLSQEQQGPNPETFWALKDVSFSIAEGEVVGVIGRNGAGKSTLLKILSRITEPTSGRAVLGGRVASLLEVGTGFHQDLTGRENIYLNGAILGMRKWEINRKFQNIVDFSEIEKFIDTPVKHYSSGMYVRLAFAVAAHLDPEILLVDEVLAVGDADFQKKCLGKMDEVSRQGRTVLFVSHNMGAVARLCKRALWFDKGMLREEGAAQAVISKYQTSQTNAKSEWLLKEDAGKQDVSFKKISVLDKKGNAKSLFNADESPVIHLEYEIRKTSLSCQIVARVDNLDGVVLFYTADTDSQGVTDSARAAGRYKGQFEIPGHFLSPGGYSVTVAAHLPRQTLYQIVENAVTFEISEINSSQSLDDRKGMVSPLIAWKNS